MRVFVVRNLSGPRLPEEGFIYYFGLDLDESDIELQEWDMEFILTS